ncbi:hypothetical protein [Actinacidiphila oryziradicis]|uniref:hypothetical protein n=1 Tax=Actinacidiphila oryziradicis TaxID=2571141 RepID=UPI00145CC602|nr:hypothetical protein [Actinacidiphila oryziradicis]
MVGVVDVALDDARGDAGVRQVVEVVVRNRGVLGEQQPAGVACAMDASVPST